MPPFTTFATASSVWFRHLGGVFGTCPTRSREGRSFFSLPTHLVIPFKLPAHLLDFPYFDCLISSKNMEMTITASLPSKSLLTTKNRMKLRAPGHRSKESCALRMMCKSIESRCTTWSFWSATFSRANCIRLAFVKTVRFKKTARSRLHQNESAHASKFPKQCCVLLD